MRFLFLFLFLPSFLCLQAGRQFLPRRSIFSLQLPVCPFFMPSPGTCRYQMRHHQSSARWIVLTLSSMPVPSRSSGYYRFRPPRSPRSSVHILIHPSIHSGVGFRIANLEESASGCCFRCAAAWGKVTGLWDVGIAASASTCQASTAESCDDDAADDDDEG